MSEEITKKEDIDVNALLEQARKKEVEHTTPDEEVATNIVGAGWAEGEVAKVTKNDMSAYAKSTINEEISEDDVEDEDAEEAEASADTFEEEEEEVPVVVKKKESTAGLIIDNSELVNDDQPAIGDLGPEVKERVNNYLDDMDAETEELRRYQEGILSALTEKGVNVKDAYQLKEARIRLLAAEVNIDDPEAIRNSDVDLSNLDTHWINEENVKDTSLEDSYKKYNEAVVIIDKSRMGVVDGFTPEERAKMRKADVIKLKEIENVSLENVVIRRPKEKKSVKDILRRSRNPFTTNVVAVASGYTAVMKGGSSYEIIALLRDLEDPVLSVESKWQLIYDKIDSMSCGKPAEFTDWLKITAAVDYDVFIYGILVATYPDEDEITFECKNPECKKVHHEFTHKYSVRSLIRAERMSDIMKQRFEATINNAGSIEMSKQYMENESPMSKVRRCKLPEAEFIVDFRIRSAYDLIYSSIKDIQEAELPADYNEIATTATSIDRILVPDYEAGLDEMGNYVYDEFTSPVDIVELIHSLRDKDLLVVNKVSDEVYSDVSFDFGLMNIICDKCHTVTPFHEMEVERILFRKLQQAAATQIE